MVRSNIRASDRKCQILSETDNRSQFLNLDEFRTLIAEITRAVNERHIAYMSDRVDELTLLRPIDFLAPLSHDRPMVNPTVSSGDDSRDSSYQPKKLSAADKLVDMWTEQSRRLQTFWNMRHEMVLLGSVERGPRPDKTTSNRRPQGQVVPNLIGQYVLVKDDSTPQYKWKRAEILDLIASSDGVIRTASIRLPSRSISRRAIYHLYPIEVELKELRPPYSIFVLKQHPRKRSSGQWKTKSSARSGTTTPTSQVHHVSQGQLCGVRIRPATREVSRKVYVLLHVCRRPVI